MAHHNRFTSALRTFGSKLTFPVRGEKTKAPRDFLGEDSNPRAFISAVDERVEDLASDKRKGSLFSIISSVSFKWGNGHRDRSQHNDETQKHTDQSADSPASVSNRIEPLGGWWHSFSHTLASSIRFRPSIFQGHAPKPEPDLAATEEFMNDLTMDDAIALLESEMAEDLAPAIVDQKEQGLARFKLIRQVSEKISELFKRRTMTITVENEVVRIVVFQDREVVAWGVANPKKDPFRGLEMARTDAEYPSRMKGLLNELKFRRLRVVADLPFYVPLMRRLQLPKIAKKYMDSVVVSEVLETVPFTDEEVDIPWQFKRSAEGSDIFAVAVPKKAVDEHVEILQALDVHPNAAYSRSTGLAFAVGIPNAIVIHLTPGQAAVILVHEGTAITVNRVELDPANLSSELQAEIVTQAVEQVEVYYQPADSAAQRTLPVLITGPLVEDGPLAEAIAGSLPNEIMPFTPAITYPEHFVPHEYAVNIGLALSDLARSKVKKRLPSERKPTVNLLSQRHLPKPWPVWPTAIFVTLLMFGVMAVNVTSRVNSAELEAGTLDTRLQNLERQERRMKLDQGQATALEQQIASIDQLQDDLVDRLTVLEQDKDYLLQRAYWMTTAALTPNVRVNSVAQQGDGFGVTGVAVSYEDVLAYAANLRGSELFTSVQVVRVSGGGSGKEMSVGFNLKTVVLPDFGVEEESDTPEGEDSGPTTGSEPSR